MATSLDKWDVKKYTIDWGAKQRGQGKRIGGGMIVGSMSDAPTGKKEYISILGNLPEYEEVKQHFGSEYEQLAYLKARNYGMNREQAEKFAYTIRD
jgi:acetyl-CoA acetyltransferase